MKHYFSFGWMLIGLVLLTTSCKTSQRATANVYQPFESALLWEVTGKELAKPSYVFGTIHIIGKEDYFLPEGFIAAMSSTEEVVFEIDIEEMMDLSSQMELMTKAFMTDGQTMKDLLTVSEYEELKAYFDDLGIPLFFLERLKPMFLTVLTSMDGNLEEVQATSTSYEFEILAKAKDEDKEIGGLETVEFQIGLFDSIPYKEQAQMLMESIRSQSSDSQQFDEMVRMYKEQNIEAMVTTIGGDETLSKYETLLLDKRNENWIPAMVEKMKARPTFFAVGAGHLGGPKGVLHLLRSQGYQLKPISAHNGSR